MYQDFVHAIRNAIIDLGATMEKLYGIVYVSFKNGSKLTVSRCDCANRSLIYNTLLYSSDMPVDHVLELGRQIVSYEEMRSFVRAAGFDREEEENAELETYLDSFRILPAT